MSTPPLGPQTPPSGHGSFAPPSAPAPAMRDVRLVVEAVQSAEEAALAYAREIGEARRYLSEAIAHLDRAEEARALLNRFATGFGGSAPGASDPAASGASGSPHGRGAAGTPPASRRASGPITTPSPGIAIAGPSSPASGPRGSATDEADDAPDYGDGSQAHNPADASSQWQPGEVGNGDEAAHGTSGDTGDSPDHGPGAPGGDAEETGGFGFGRRAQLGSMPNPLAPPPPRPGGWGPGSGTNS